MRKPILILLFLSLATVAEAQRIEPIGISPRVARTEATRFSSRDVTATHITTAPADLPGNSGMPRWLRWGLVGAIGGAVLFTAVDGLNGNSHSVGSDILAGAATGFVVVGGGVLVYDAICSNGTRRSGC